MKQLTMIAGSVVGLLGATTAFAGSPLPTQVPVPAAWALIAIGVGALYLFRRK